MEPERSDTGATIDVTAADTLPLPHRVSIVYLAAPVVVWLVGWFKWWVGIPLAGLMIAGLWKSLSGSWRVSLSMRLFALLLAGLAWILLTPVSGLWKFNGDFNIKHAEMLDLARGGWPTYLTDYLYDSPPLFSYYLGYHMVPSLAGKYLGSMALGWALPIWTWTGIGLIIVLFVRRSSRLSKALVGIAVLIFFSGMDALEYILHNGMLDGFELMLEHLRHNFILEFYPEKDSVRSEYYSNSHNLWWSPQHLIPGGLLSLTIIQLRRESRFLAISGVLLAICLFWSPLVAVGCLPLVASLAVRQGMRAFLKWPNLIISPLLISLISLYLLSTKPSDLAGWIWQYPAISNSIIVDLLVLYLAEFGLLAIVLYRIDNSLIRDTIFVTSLIILLIAPLCIYASPTEHFIMTRGTLPALIVLSYYTYRVLMSYSSHMPPPQLPSRVGSDRPTQNLNLSNPPGGGGISRSVRASIPSMYYLLLIVILIVGAITPLFTFLRSTNYFDMEIYVHEYERLERTLLISGDQAGDQALERIISNVPRLLQIFLKDTNSRGLPIGTPVSSSKYDIYLQKQTNALVYLNRDCVFNLEKGSYIFLKIQPADSSNLPDSSNYISNAGFPLYSGNDDCIGTFGLPRYEIDKIVVGQYTPYLGIDWAVEYRFNDNGEPLVHHTHPFKPIDTYHPYYSYYRLAEPSNRIIDSTFRVHLISLHNNTLVYTKDPCSESDTSLNFFLHVIPVETEDIPFSRRQLGFENYDFPFYSRGIIFDDRCLAIVTMPDYEIASIRTGQFDSAANDSSGGQILWQEETAINR